MTTDTLTEAVLDEAEVIVCAEWMRLQHDSAQCDDEFTRPCAEMPAAQPALDLIDICFYGDHCASKRTQAALP